MALVVRAVVCAWLVWRSMGGAADLMHMPDRAAGPAFPVELTAKSFFFAGGTSWFCRRMVLACCVSDRKELQRIEAGLVVRAWSAMRMARAWCMGSEAAQGCTRSLKVHVLGIVCPWHGAWVAGSSCCAMYGQRSTPRGGACMAHA